MLQLIWYSADAKHFIASPTSVHYKQGSWKTDIKRYDTDSLNLELFQNWVSYKTPSNGPYPTTVHLLQPVKHSSLFCWQIVTWFNYWFLCLEPSSRLKYHTCIKCNFQIKASNSGLIYIQQDATLHGLLYLETAPHVSGGTTTHHQERKQPYLQHLVFVRLLLLPAAIAAGSSNGVAVL